MTKINRSVIESYLACRYKAFLKLTEPMIAAPDKLYKTLPDESSRFRPASADVKWYRRVKPSNSSMRDNVIFSQPGGNSHLRWGVRDGRPFASYRRLTTGGWLIRHWELPLSTMRNPGGRSSI